MATIEYRSPRDQTELDDSLRCSARAFGGSESILFSSTSIVKHDPWFHLDNTRACFVDGKVVSVVQIFDRPVRVGSCVVRMGGIGNVGTDPDYRRAGYSFNVLKDSIRYMKAVGYDISVLFTDIQSHYARTGWVIYPTYSVRLTLPETPGEMPCGLTIEQCEPERDLPAVMAIYDRFNATRTGTLVRTEAYWHNQPKWRNQESALFWIAKRNRKTVAYLKAGRWTLREFGCLPGDEKALAGLFSHFFHQAKLEGVNEMSMPCPSEFRKEFEILGCRTQRQESCFMMIRIISLASLLGKVRPLLEARLSASSFSRREGSICIRYEVDERRLVIKNGRISISKFAASPDIDLAVNQEQLLKLLFGNVRTEHIAFSNGLEFNGDEIGLLDTLFPPDELFLWKMDAF